MPLTERDKKRRSTDTVVSPVRDLIDFHLRWHEFRPFAVEAVHLPELSAMQTETVEWLIKLADRIQEKDI